MGRFSTFNEFVNESDGGLAKAIERRLDPEWIEDNATTDGKADLSQLVSYFMEDTDDRYDEDEVEAAIKSYLLKHKIVAEGEAAVVAPSKSARDAAIKAMCDERNTAYGYKTGTKKAWSATKLTDGYYYGEDKMADKMLATVADVNKHYFSGTGWKVVPDGPVKTEWDRKGDFGTATLPIKVVPESV